MKDNQMNLEEQITAFMSGEFDSKDKSTQCRAGWYDWFCRDSSLQAKTEKLYRKVIQVARLLKSHGFSLKDHYVFFKNNCPGMGKLYDSFSICEIGSGDVKFFVTPSSGHTIDNGKAQVYFHKNKFEEPMAEGKWKDIIEFFAVLRNF
jgi:hypothetical protein